MKGRDGFEEMIVKEMLLENFPSPINLKAVFSGPSKFSLPNAESEALITRTILSYILRALGNKGEYHSSALSAILIYPSRFPVIFLPLVLVTLRFGNLHISSFFDPRDPIERLDESLVPPLITHDDNRCFKVEESYTKLLHIMKTMFLGYIFRERVKVVTIMD